MFSQFNLHLKKHLASNIGIYALVLFFFILGISLGAISIDNINSTIKDEILNYIQGFLKLASNESFDKTLVLKQSIKLNLYSTAIIFLSGLSSIGIVTIPAYLIFRGYCFGFTIGFLSQTLGNNGFIISLSAILPQSIIMIPIIIVLAVIGIRQSISKAKGRFVKKLDQERLTVFSYFITILLLTLFLLAGSFIEAYFTPLIISLVAPYVI